MLSKRCPQTTVQATRTVTPDAGGLSGPRQRPPFMCGSNAIVRLCRRVEPSHTKDLFLLRGEFLISEDPLFVEVGKFLELIKIRFTRRC